MTQKTTHWFDSRSRTCYSVSGAENHERMQDVIRAARFNGIRIYSVGKSWVAYQRKHDPFAKEIMLTDEPSRTTDNRTNVLNYQIRSAMSPAT